MKIFYGINKDGIPYRKKHTRKFKARVIITDLAVREECDRCGSEFWRWPERHDKHCAWCQFVNLFNLPNQEAK